MNDKGQQRSGEELEPALEVVEPSRLSAPLVFDSPHSGAHYPSAFLAASRLDPSRRRWTADSPSASAA